MQRLQKTLEDANIKLDSVISDMLGMSGRAMLEALIAGESDPEPSWRALAHPPAQGVAGDAARGAARPGDGRHHRFLLRLHLHQIDALDAAIGRDRPGGRRPVSPPFAPPSSC